MTGRNPKNWRTGLGQAGLEVNLMIGQWHAAEPHSPHPKRRRPVLADPLVWFQYGHGGSELFYIPVYGGFVLSPPHCGSPPPIRLRSSFVALLRFLLSRSSFLSFPFLRTTLFDTSTINNLANHLVPPNPRLSYRHLDSSFSSLIIPPHSTLYTSNSSCTVHALSSLSCDLYTRWSKLMVCCSLNPTVIQCLPPGTSSRPSSCVL